MNSLPLGGTNGAPGGWQQGLGDRRPERGGLAWSSRQMEPGLNQGRQRKLERRRWIPEYSGGDFVDERDAPGEAMLGFLMGWGGVCDWKMEALYVLKVVPSPSLLQSRLLEKGVLGTPS